MDQIKQQVDRREEEQRRKYETFHLKKKGDEFLTDSGILSFKLYQYKEFLRLFASNFYSPAFQGARHSFYASLLLPSITALGFNLVSPYSVFRRMAVVSSFFAGTIAFYFTLKEELDEQARKDTPLGAAIRERSAAMAVFDPLYSTYQEESQKILEKRRN